MKGRKLVWGVFFIAAAVLLVVNQLGYFTGVNLWSLLLTIMIVPVIGSGLARLNFFNVFFGIAFLLIIFAKPLGITALVPWTVLFAALFLSIGFSILIKPRRWPGSLGMHGHNWSGHNHNYEEYETVDHVEGNDVNCYVSMGGSCKYLRSDSLESGRFECSLGYLKVYFDNVILSPKGANIYLDCSMGNIELFIPRNWNVKLNIDSMMGNVGEQHHTYTQDAPSLTITGNVKLGNIDIKYV